MPPSRLLIMPGRKAPASPEPKSRLRHLNESLFFGLDHVRSAITEWREDFNTARPHSSLGCQTPAVFGGTLTATCSDAALNDGFASLAGRSTRAPRRNRNGRGSNRGWMTGQRSQAPLSMLSFLSAPGCMPHSGAPALGQFQVFQPRQAGACRHPAHRRRGHARVSLAMCLPVSQHCFLRLTLA